MLRLVAFAWFGDRASVFYRELLLGLFLLPRRLDGHVPPGIIEGRSSTCEEAAVVNFRAGVDLRWGGGRLGDHFAVGHVAVLEGCCSVLVAFSFPQKSLLGSRVYGWKDGKSALFSRSRIPSLSSCYNL